VYLEESEALWAANQSVDHLDVSLPHGWHLNRARVPVPSVPPVGPRLDAEIRCRIRNLPLALREDRQYWNRQFWHDFLAWEETARSHTARHKDYQLWEAYEVVRTTRRGWSSNQRHSPSRSSSSTSSPTMTCSWRRHSCGRRSFLRFLNFAL
jgi:hypothetical protein